MIMMVINKRKLKKIIVFIAIILFIVGGVIYTLNKSSQTINLLEMAENKEPYITGTNIYSGYVAITCNVDLGWEDEYIDSILETLDKESVKITFAVTGKWAEKNKKMLIKIKERGHEIANHGYQHLDYDKLSYEENLEQIEKSKKAIENSLKGKGSRFFQAPSGAFSADTVKAANELGYTCYKWDVDTVDWMYKDSPETILSRFSKKEIKSSSIVLIHPTKATTMCLKDIISEIRTRGYKPGTLSDVFI